MSDNHQCQRDNSNIVFYSRLWKSWALKIFPGNYDKMPEEYKTLEHFQPVMITIKFCPYCGKTGEEMEKQQELKCDVCQTKISGITDTTTLCKECDDKLDGQGVYN